MRRKHREVPVILLFPRLHPERAKEALRLGAMAVLKYPGSGGRAAGGRLAGARALRGAAVEPASRRSRSSRASPRRRPSLPWLRLRSMAATAAPRAAHSRRIRAQFARGLRRPARGRLHRRTDLRFHHSASISTPASSAWSATIRAGAR